MSCLSESDRPANAASSLAGQVDGLVVGRVASGGIVGMGRTFHAQGGTEGFSDVATGVRNAGQNAVGSAVDRSKGGWEKATGHLPDAVTEWTDALGQSDKQEVSQGESSNTSSGSDLIKE